MRMKLGLNLHEKMDSISIFVLISLDLYIFARIYAIFSFKFNTYIITYISISNKPYSNIIVIDLLLFSN